MSSVTVVGDLVGTAVGAALGAAVGIAVGLSVGEAVGEAVGVAVGDPLGAAVGVSDGSAVGPALGAAVGAADGTAVGGVDGEAVGTAVGDAVHAPATFTLAHTPRQFCSTMGVPHWLIMSATDRSVTLGHPAISGTPLHANPSSADPVMLPLLELPFVETVTAKRIDKSHRAFANNTMAEPILGALKNHTCQMQKHKDARSKHDHAIKERTDFRDNLKKTHQSKFH